MISGLRHGAPISLPPPSISMAAVMIPVLGQRALTAMLCGCSSSDIPSTHMLIPYFAIVYAASQTTLPLPTLVFGWCYFQRANGLGAREGFEWKQIFHHMTIFKARQQSTILSLCGHVPLPNASNYR